MKYLWLIAGIFLLLFLSGCSKDNVEPEASPENIFNTVWSDFDRTYPYFTHKSVDWDSVRNVYLKDISDDMSSTSLAQTIGEMTLTLRDVHVSFNTSFASYHYTKRELFPENPPKNVKNYLTNITMDNGVALMAEISNTNYFYLQIKNFTGGGAAYQQIADALDAIEDKEGVVIDIRENGGGDETNGRTIAGRFMQTSTPYKLVRTRDGGSWDDFTDWNTSYLVANDPLNYYKTLVLLTNRGVYSSAELFTLMLMQYPNLILVGDTTGGASANPALKKLSNGWTYRVSTWQCADLNQKLIEDYGIAPDHYVLMDGASIAAGKDLILEKAVELLDQQRGR